MTGLLPEHTHSVEKWPVTEIFPVGQGGIAMEGARFDAFGRNLPPVPSA